MSRRTIQSFAAALVVGGAIFSPAHANIPYNPAQYDAKLITLIGLDDLLVPVPVTFDPPGDHLVYQADFNGDGITDLFLQGMGNNDSSYILLGHRNSAGAIEYRSINQSWNNGHLGQQWTANASNIYVGDYNGDGRADLIVESKATGGNNALLYSNGQGQFTQTYVTWVNAPAAAVPPTLPTVIGAVPGVSEVSPTGALTYSIPITVPPGASGMQPSLALNYSSQAGDGLMGVGWSLSGFSVIHRCPRTLTQDGAKGGINFDANDRYCLDGQRLISIGAYGGGTEYRTEIDSFSRVIGYGSQGSGHAYFKVWTKAGQIMEYGVSGDARIEATAPNAASVRVWAVNKIQDTVGNYISLHYNENTSTGEYYPTEIKYTGNATAGVAPSRSVKFFYKSRSEVSTGYMAGSVVNSSVLLTNIQTFITTGGLTNLVFDYRLQYQPESAAITRRSRLARIDQCGTSTCVNGTVFEWQSGQANFMIAGSKPSSIETPYTWTGDFTGDGKSNFVQKNSSGSVTITSWNGLPLLASSQTRSVSTPWGPSDKTWTGDFNGDGLTDIVTAVGATAYVHISTSTGFLAPQQWNGLTVPSGTTTFNCANSFSKVGYVGDFNGDGVSDIATNCGTVIYLHLSTRTSFNVVAVSVPHNWGEAHVTWAGDFNGDGMTDIATASGPNVWVYRSTGTGFVAEYWPVTATWGGAGYSKVGDINGDGLMDIVSIGSTQVYVKKSTGRGFISETWNAQYNWSGIAPGYIWIADVNNDGRADVVTGKTANAVNVQLAVNNGLVPATWTGPSSWSSTDTTQLGDFNGDGKLDIITGTTLLAPDMYYYPPEGMQPSYPDMLTAVTDGLGMRTRFAYSSLTDSSSVFGVYTKGSGALDPLVDVQIPMYVARAITTDDGVGGTLKRTYKYGAARVHRTGRGFAGFAWMEETTPANIVGRSDFRQDFPYTGLVSASSQKFGSGIIESVTNTWNSASTTYGSHAVTRLRLDKEVRSNYEILGGPLIKTVTTTNSYDLYGNLTAATVQTVGGGKTFETITSNTITNDTSNWFLGRLIRSVVTNKQPNAAGVLTAGPARTSSFEYETASGLLKSETIEPDNASLWQKNSYSYDVFGNKITATVSGADIVSRTSTTAYGHDGIFPISASNALGQIEQRSHDARFGGVTRLTGPNGLTTSWTYDDFGRKIMERRADGTSTQWSMGLCTSCTGSAFAYGYYFVNETSSGQAPVTTYFDRYGRKIVSAGLALDGRQVIQYTKYDFLGRVSRQSRPGYNITNTETAYAYDILGRETHRTDANYTLYLTSYAGFQTTLRSDANAKNQTTVRTTNALGQLLQVKDSLNGTTSYEYDSHGNLIKTIDAAGNVTTMSYDIRGRKTAMYDPDMGQWYYAYNTLGELIWQKDAKNQVTSMQYDKLGRMTQRVEPEGTSVWTYDSAGGAGVGKLHSISRAADAYSQVISYDGFGRASSVTTTIFSESYTQRSSYDAYGRVSEITYPTGFAVRNVYNERGYLSEVRNAASNGLYWQANSTTADGQLERETLGNNVVSLRVYDALGRMEGVSAGVGSSSSVQYNTYAYDALGNLTQRKDINQNFTENFSYDGLNRLTSATLVGIGVKTYTYDAIGNIKSKSDFGNEYLYGSGKPHAVSTVKQGATTVATYNYDANGNLLNGYGWAISYTSFNKPQNLSQGSEYSTFQYAPDRRRIVQTSSHGTTIYISPSEGAAHYEKEYNNGVTEHKHYINGGGGPVAIYTSRSNGVNDTRYLHKDHLGSIDVITNEAGAVVHKLSYDVFGQRRPVPNCASAVCVLTSAVTHHGYTGHEHIDSVGLIHMNGRVYDPQLGRFLSADPTVAYPESTQGLNRYSYTDNNPLSRVDMNGYNWWSDRWQSGRPAITAVAAIAVAIYAPGAFSALGPVGSNMAAGFLSGAVASGGNLKAALLSGFTAGLFMGIGQFEPVGLGQRIGKIVGHGLIGGLSQEMMGGEFRAGFWSAAMTQSFSGWIGRQGGAPGPDVARTMYAAMIGGTASVLGGGKFANGAVTGAFSRLFNDEATHPGEGTRGSGALGKFGRALGKLGQRIFGPVASLIGLDDVIQRNAYLNHYTTEAGRVGILRDEIIMRSSDGNVYLTPDLYVSGAEAQARLSLSQQPTGYFSVPLENINSVSGQGVVQPLNGQPGGGIEILVPHDVSTRRSRWYPIGP